jgi:Zn finger protein HypA/HybF involved in hydrogenase expression
MPTKREELEEQIVEHTREAVQKMLDELPDSRSITVSEMERAIVELGQAINRQTLQCLLEAQGSEQAEEVSCEECGVRMQRRGKRRKRVVTLGGEVDVERDYYVCPKCGSGHFPPG